MTWAKGQSGNPGGCSRKVRELRKVLEGDAVKAEKVVRKALDSDDVEIQLEAAKIVFTYTLPKPTASLELTGKDGGPVKYADMSTAELKRLLAEQMAAK